MSSRQRFSNGVKKRRNPPKRRKKRERERKIEEKPYNY